MELWEIRLSAHYINAVFNVLLPSGTTTELFDNSVEIINVSLKVSKPANKGQYERYGSKEMTKFTMVNDIPSVWVSSVWAVQSAT